MLILSDLASNGYYLTVTDCLTSISKKYGIAESTLRWNVNVLRKLGLIHCKNRDIIKLNKNGKIVCKILEM
ncbi:MAG: hypothetical protein GF368_02240 [Candidatus Aenigmarchaeota archaeon]|nr:hypothetical protein [Candidatus Aenigmarchaeota archaeon]